MNLHDPYEIVSGTSEVARKDDRITIKFTNQGGEENTYIISEILEVRQHWATDEMYLMMKLYDPVTNSFNVITASYKHHNNQIK